MIKLDENGVVIGSQYHRIDPLKCISKEYCNSQIGRYFNFLTSYMDKKDNISESFLSKISVYDDFTKNDSLNETLDDVCLNEYDESFTKALFNTIFGPTYIALRDFYNNTNDNPSYTIMPEKVLLNKSKVDFLIKSKDIMNSNININRDIIYAEVKPMSGSIRGCLHQSLDYIREDRPVDNRYVIAMQGPLISYFIYQKNWHLNNGCEYKAPLGQDLLGLAYD
jgi:hypothetical protein